MEYYDRGLEKHNSGNYQSAIADYNEAIRLDPNLVYAYNGRGHAKRRINDFRGAITDYNEAIRLDPNLAYAYNGRGNAKCELNDYRGAITDYNEAIRLDPSFAIAYNNRGSAKCGLNDYRGAITDCIEAIRLDPNDAIAYNGRGYAKNSLNDYRGAITDYNEAIRLDPSFAIAYHNRGYAKCELNDYRGATTDYTEAIRLDPNEARGYVWRGVAKKKINDHSGAMADFNKALQCSPKESRDYYRRALVKKELKDYSGIIEDCTQAIRMDPNLAPAFALRGIAKKKFNDLNGALSDCNQALQLDPYYVDGYIARGSIKKKKKDYQGAIVDYKTAIEKNPYKRDELQPKIEKVKKLIAEQSCEQGDEKKFRGNYSGAISDYSEALQYNPSDFISYKNRGMAKAELKDYEGAISDYQKAIELHAAYREELEPKIEAVKKLAFEHYCEQGDVKKAQGNYADAVSNYNKAIQYHAHDFLSYKNRGISHYHLKKYSFAVRDLTEALSINANDVESYVYRAMSYQELKKYQKAIKGYRTAIRLNPAEEQHYQQKISELTLLIADSYRHQGNVKKAQGDLAGALMDYAEAIRLNPQDKFSFHSRALIHYEQHDYNEAIDDLNQAMLIDADYSSCLIDRGMVKKAMQNYPGAIADYELVIQFNPRSRAELQPRIEEIQRIIALEHRNQGDAKNAEEDYAGAILAYTESIRLNPQDAHSYLRRGNAYYALKNYLNANTDYQEVIRLNPNDPSAHFNLGLVSFQLQHYQEAISHFNKVVSLDAHYSGVYEYRAIAKENLQDYQGAINDYEKLIEQDPTQAYILKPKIIPLKKLLADKYQQTGEAKKAQKNYAEAVSDYTKALEYNPEDAKTYRQRGSANYFLQRYQHAIRDCDAALGIDSTDEETYLTRGNAYFALKRHQEAVTDYEAAIRINPSDKRYCYNCGLAHHQLKKYPEAIRHFDQAIELDSHYAEAYKSRGYAKWNVEAYEDAIADFEKACELEANYREELASKLNQLKKLASKKYQQAGDAKRAQGDYEEAISDYTHAIHYDAQESTLYKNRGITHYQVKKYQEAVTDLNQFLLLINEDAESYRYRGLSYYELANYQNALMDLTKAILLNSKDAESYRYRGVTHEILEKRSEAIADYKKAINLQAAYRDELQPKIDAIREQLALLRRQQGDGKKTEKNYEEAIKDYEAALKYDAKLQEILQPEIAELKKLTSQDYRDQGNVKEGQKDYTGAIASYSKAIQFNALVAGIFIDRAFAYLQLKQYENALKDCNRGIEIEPNKAIYYIQRAKAQQMSNRPIDALADYEKASSLDNTYQEKLNSEIQQLKPQVAEAYRKRGDVKKDQQQYAEALKEYNRAIDYYSQDIEARLSRGFVNEKLNRISDALIDYELTVTLDPSKQNLLGSKIVTFKKQLAKNHLQRGIKLQDQKRYEEALKAYNQANNIDPQNAAIYYQRGKFYLIQQTYAKAELEFNHAIRLEEKNADYFRYRGESKEAQQKYESALIDYQSAIRINPSHRTGLQTKLNHLRYQLLEQSFTEERYSEAVHYCDAILQEQAQNQEQSARALEVLQQIDLNPAKLQTLSEPAHLLVKKYLGLVPAFQQLMTPFNVGFSMCYRSQEDSLLISATDWIFLSALERFLQIQLNFKVTREAQRHSTLMIDLKQLTASDCEEKIMQLSQLAQGEFLFALTRYLTAMNIELTLESHKESLAASMLRGLTRTGDPELEAEKARLQELKEADQHFYEAIDSYRKAYQHYKQSKATYWVWMTQLQGIAQNQVQANLSPLFQQRKREVQQQIKKAKEQCDQSFELFIRLSEKLRKVYDSYGRSRAEHFDHINKTAQQKLDRAYQARQIAEESYRKTELAYLSNPNNSRLAAQLEETKQQVAQREAEVNVLEGKVQKQWAGKEKAYQALQTRHWQFMNEVNIDFMWFKEFVFAPALEYATFKQLKGTHFKGMESLSINGEGQIRLLAEIVFKKLKEMGIVELLHNEGQRKLWQTYLCAFFQETMLPLEANHGSVQFNVDIKTFSQEESRIWVERLQTAYARKRPINDSWWKKEIKELPDKLNWYALSMTKGSGFMGCDLLPFLFQWQSRDQLPSTHMIWETIKAEQEAMQGEEVQPSAPPVSGNESSVSSGLRSFASLFKPSAPPFTGTGSVVSSARLSERFRPSAPPLSTEEGENQYPGNRLAHFRHTFFGASMPKLFTNYRISYQELRVNEGVGEGGFGKVFKGSWGESGATVAIKQLSEQRMNEAGIAVFDREVGLLSGLRHPNIISFYGACFEAGHYSLVMEYMPKGSLYSVLQKRKNLLWGECYKVATGIVSGLSYLHSNGIWHRDLKSPNVLLTENGEAKLTDFGLSTCREEISANSARGKGTLLWMAPEVITEGKEAYSDKAEVYSLGIIFWELVAGKLPFQDEQDRERIKERIKAGKLDEVPKACQERYPFFANLIISCRAKDPKERPTLREVSRILTDNPIEETESEGLVNITGITRATGTNETEERAPQSGPRYRYTTMSSE